MEHRAAAPLRIWLACPSCSFLMSFEQPWITNRLNVTWEGRSVHEVKIRGEALSESLLLLSAIGEKPKKEDQPTFRRAVMGSSSLDLVAQLPRT